MLKYISYTNWLHIMFVVSLIILLIMDLDNNINLLIVINVANILLFFNTVIYSNIERTNMNYKKLYESQNKRLRKDNIDNIINKI